MKKETGKLALFLAVGMAIGSAIVYFSDREKRNRFVKDIDNLANKTKESVKDGYNDTVQKYYEYRDFVKEKADKYYVNAKDYVNEKYDSAKGKFNDVADDAKELAAEGKQKAKDIAEKVENKAKDLATDVKDKINR